MEEEGDHNNNKDTAEVAPALIAVHPTHKSVTVAVGSELRVFDLQGSCRVTLVDESGGPSHKDSIRAIRYGSNGNLFVSAGDDKLVKIWSADSWHCISTVFSEKRVSAVAVNNDGSYVCFADKFGVVWAVELQGLDATQAFDSKKTAPIFAHYCSIITRLEFSPDGNFIVSADRDFKIRVTVFPKKPLSGAHEIQSFCLGHTEFVSCLAFVHDHDHCQGYLVSGSGDSTVRLWDVTSGSLLDTCEVGLKAGAEGPIASNVKEDGYSAITDLCMISDGTLLAVALQSLRGVLLLRCDLSARTLSVAKVIPVEGETFIPTSLGTSSSGLLWMVTGVSNPQCSDHPPLARVKVISGTKQSDMDSVEPVVLEDEKIPGGEKSLEVLQGSACIKEDDLQAAAEAVRKAMFNLLIKKQYSVDHREIRKRTRNDKKIKQ